MDSKSSTSEAQEDLVVVGVVRRPHGLLGELAIEVLSDVPGRIAPGVGLWLVSATGARQQVTVAAARPHREHLLVKLAGVADRTAAEPLKGASLEIERSKVPAAAEGAFYHFELVGCRCQDRALGTLGEVADVVEGPGATMLRVVGEKGELLIPFVESFLGDIDVVARTIEVVLPEGFLDVCGSKS